MAYFRFKVLFLCKIIIKVVSNNLQICKPFNWIQKYNFLRIQDDKLIWVESQELRLRTLFILEAELINSKRARYQKRSSQRQLQAIVLKTSVSLSVT